MSLGFVDLVKAFDTVPREMVMATVRWMGVPEAEMRMVEGMHEKTAARVVVGEGASEEFEVKIGLKQGTVLSLLLFITVQDIISRKTVVKDAMKKLLYADDLVLVANGKQELQETMEKWNGLFTKHGLKQLGPNNSKSNEGRQANNGGVKGRDRSAEELNTETGQEQITVDWTGRQDGG